MSSETARSSRCSSCGLRYTGDHECPPEPRHHGDWEWDAEHYDEIAVRIYQGGGCTMWFRKLFEDVIEATDAVSNHIRIHSDGDDLLFSGNDDESESKAVVSDVVTGDGADSMFSLDYFKSLVKGLKTVDVDEITIRAGDEFPVQIEWETEWNETPVTGKWFQAPRIQSGGPDV